MTSVSVKTNNGRKVILHRSYTVTPETATYLTPTKFQMGVENSTPSITTTSLDYPIPIADGTVNDAAMYPWTGSLGGDNTTANTSVYKEGAGVLDNTAQNLLTSGGSLTKQWTKSTLSANVVTTQYFSQWLYIKDATALAKFSTTTTPIEIRLGSSSSVYYYFYVPLSYLATGWNLLTTNKTLVSALSVSGSPGALSRIDIVIKTNNAADAFIAGDVVYDLSRQWTEADTKVVYDVDYPVLDYTNLEATRKITINSAQANGYPINVIGTYNTDTTPLLTDIHTITESVKGTSDEFQYFIVDRIR